MTGSGAGRLGAGSVVAPRDVSTCTLVGRPWRAHSGRVITNQPLTKSVLSAFNLVALTVVTWWVFLGLDNTRDVDPITGSTSGPYEAPQVIACVVVLIGLVVAGTIALSAWVAVIAVAIPFTATWAVWAKANDDSGLWVIGVVMVLIGTVCGGTLVATVTAFLRPRKDKGARPTA